MPFDLRKWWPKHFLYGLCAVLIVSNSLTLVYFWPETEAVSESNPYSFVDPSRRLVEQKNLIVNLQPLRELLNQRYESNPKISIYFEYLPTGANIAINKDAEFYPASLLKVPVAVAGAKKI